MSGYRLQVGAEFDSGEPMRLDAVLCRRCGVAVKIPSRPKCGEEWEEIGTAMSDLIEKYHCNHDRTWEGVNQIVGERLSGWRGAWGWRITKKRLAFAQLGARMLADELGILNE